MSREKSVGSLGLTGLTKCILQRFTRRRGIMRFTEGGELPFDVLPDGTCYVLPAARRRSDVAVSLGEHGDLLRTHFFFVFCVYLVFESHVFFVSAYVQFVHVQR